MQGAVQKKRRITTLVSLVIAGEAVFFLPFVMARIFRPTLLQVFEISNTELGTYFSAYGVVAMISYLFGGVLADRFPARNLMSASLFLTSLGGFIMVSVPGGGIMTVLYGFWGFTSIFLFWAAMIRATREWGGDHYQGRAFGWLEGGRGATAAIVGSVAFLVFYRLSPETMNPNQVSQGFHPFQMVILLISIFTLISGILVWFTVPVNSQVADSVPSMPTIPSEPSINSEPSILTDHSSASVFSVPRLVYTVKKPGVWMLSVIIICAYVGYKITDVFSLYAKEVLGFTEAGAAGIGTAALWIRAITAIAAGYLSDRLDHTRVIIVCFVITVISGLLTATGYLESVTGLVLLNMSLTAAGIYAVRALYFAVLKEARIPLGYTGTAVGIMSLAGFTPDVFMSPWMGYLLDNNPGNTGHQYVFLVLSGFAMIGTFIGILFRKYENLNKE